MHDRRSRFDIVFEMGHEVSAVAFDLLVRRDGAEDDFGEMTGIEGLVCDSSSYFERLLDDREQNPSPSNRLALFESSGDNIWRLQ